MPIDVGSNALPRLLVSVRDADEAALAAGAGADLVDAKDPGVGALGALPAATVRAIVERVGAGALTSAVAGEPETEAGLLAAVSALAATGATYVKVALPAAAPNDRLLARAAARAPARLIAVLFAEDFSHLGVPAETIARLAGAGFAGAMIDTRGKGGLRLGDHLAPATLAGFVGACRGHGLLCGLAGSLRAADIPALAALGPDYLGLRGGLCRDGVRTAGLDPDRVRAAVRALRMPARRSAA